MIQVVQFAGVLPPRSYLGVESAPGDQLQIDFGPIRREQRLHRRVAHDALVDVDTVRYSVPHRLVCERGGRILIAPYACGLDSSVRGAVWPDHGQVSQLCEAYAKNSRKFAANASRMCERFYQLEFGRV